MLCIPYSCSTPFLISRIVRIVECGCLVDILFGVFSLGFLLLTTIRYTKSSSFPLFLSSEGKGFEQKHVKVFVWVAILGKLNTCEL